MVCSVMHKILIIIHRLQAVKRDGIKPSHFQQSLRRRKFDCIQSVAAWKVSCIRPRCLCQCRTGESCRRQTGIPRDSLVLQVPGLQLVLLQKRRSH